MRPQIFGGKDLWFCNTRINVLGRQQFREPGGAHKKIALASNLFGPGWSVWAGLEWVVAHLYFSVRACCILHKQLHAHSRSRRTQQAAFTFYLPALWPLQREQRKERPWKRRGPPPSPAARNCPRRAAPSATGPAPSTRKRRRTMRITKTRPRSLMCPPASSAPLCCRPSSWARPSQVRSIDLWGQSRVYILCGSRLGTEVALWFRSGKWALAHQILYVCAVHIISHSPGCVSLYCMDRF